MLDWYTEYGIIPELAEWFSEHYPAFPYTILESGQNVFSSRFVFTATRCTLDGKRCGPYIGLPERYEDALKMTEQEWEMERSKIIEDVKKSENNPISKSMAQEVELIKRCLQAKS